MDDIVQIRRHSETVPDPTLPRFQHIEPRGFGLDSEARQFGGSGVAAADLPLTLVRGTEGNKIRVVDGTVNGQHPTLGGTSLDNDPAPEITVSADVRVWIKVVCTYGSPDTYAITIETTTDTDPPAEAEITGTGFTSCFYIGYAEFTGGGITAIVNNYGGGNLGVESFGNVNLWWSL